MRTINEEAGRWVQVIAFATIWFGFLALEGHLEVSVRAFTAIPHVVFVYSLLVLIFWKWGWRWRFFRGWLVELPDLQGTWKGTLSSTHIDSETGKAAEKVAAELVIVQTFSEIGCLLKTTESTSESTAALLSKAPVNDTVRLSYVYSNRPMAAVKHRSEMHDGAALLIYSVRPRRELTGQYWTSRKSTGDMRFVFESPET